MGIQTVEAMYSLFLEAVSATQVTMTIRVYDGSSGPS